VPFTSAHLGPFGALLDDRDVQRFTRMPVPPPPDYVSSWLARYEQGREHGLAEAFAVVDTDTGEFLGVAVAVRIDREARTAELGYTVAPDARGRGVASAALRLLTEWALADLGMLRLELIISVDNEASKRVAERAGYVREGVLRSVHLKGDVREDAELWSRLPSDPERSVPV
jgi:RimJ/RimL family protein N-acetyltransferase